MKPFSLLDIWNKLSAYPGGKWLFSQAICWKAPYFSTISPRFVTLQKGHAQVTMKKRRRVHNHIQTVHAIAVCNLAEVAAGIMMEASIPSTHRWIPHGMTVEYLKKTKTHLRGVAKLEPFPVLGDEGLDVPVSVEVFDANDQLVVKAVIQMYVSPKHGQQKNA